MDNDELKLDILDKFKTLNSIKDNDKDEIYKIYIEKSIQSILNLTNRYEMPLELKYVVIEMLDDFYNTKIRTIISDDNNFVQSLSEEGRSVTFGNTSVLALTSSISADINFKLENRKKEIYRYKLLYKMKGKK